MKRTALVLVSVATVAEFLCATAAGLERVISTTAQLQSALAAAVAGDEIVLQPGVYNGGHYRANLNNVTIRSADPANRAIIQGGSNGFQLSDATNVTIADLIFRNQTGNGLNIDDGGSYNTPTTGITLRNLLVQDITTAGNFDGIKLSGVDDFLIDGVVVRNWGTGGSAVDMVGCHHGLIQNSHFVHSNSANGGTTLQPKGGTKDVTFRANRIELPPDAGRAVQAGGSTGSPFFRFTDGDSNYEADEIVAEGNVIIGGSSAFSWVNIDGGIFHHNVVHRPYRWVGRILNENAGNSIIDTQNGKFHDNRIVYNDTGSEFSTAVNVGPETLPATFSFARNRWLNLANQTAAGSTPNLPVVEAGGIYGGDPAASIDTPIVWDFPWGKWVVNANNSEKSIELPGFAALHRAVPGANSKFQPQQNDPLLGSWSSAPLAGANLALPAFSQVILIDPVACPNCVSMIGDYNDDGRVDFGDYQTWRQQFGSPFPAADGNEDGRVDAADYLIWRQAMDHLGDASSVDSLARPVPEPKAAALSLLVWAWRRGQLCRSRHISPR